MADFYSQMADMARDLLAPTSQGGLGQGVIVLARDVEGAPPANPWEPPAVEEQTERLHGAVRGVSKELVGVEMDGTIVLASDRQAICTVPTMGYTAGDRLSVDGVPVTIVAVSNIPAAGTVAAVRFIIRG